MQSKNSPPLLKNKKVTSLTKIFGATLIAPFLFGIINRGDNMAMKDGTKVITLRVDEQLKFELERLAFKQDRSLNNFITHVLKECVESEKNRSRT